MFRNGFLFFFVEENREIGPDWRAETLPLNLGDIVSAVKGKNYRCLELVRPPQVCANFYKAVDGGTFQHI